MSRRSGRSGAAKHPRRARPTSASKDLDPDDVADVVHRARRNPFSLVFHDEHRRRSNSSPVSSGHTEELEPIGETSTTGTRQRVRMLHGTISDCIISDIN